MVDDGTLVTVRALWPMPGVPDGAVLAVVWGPRIACLVDAGRYELLSPAPSRAGDVTGEVAGPAAGDDRGVVAARRRRGRAP